MHMDRFIAAFCIGIAVFAVVVGIQTMYALSQMNWSVVMR
jgi:hypothetical protein